MRMKMKKRKHLIKVIEPSTCDLPDIPEEESKEDVSSVLSEEISEFLHELENISPENSCEKKAVNMLDCLTCILTVLKWLVGLVLCGCHTNKKRE